MRDHIVQDMDDIPEDLSFDMSLLDEQLYPSSEVFNGVKKLPDVLNNDVGFLDQSWMNSYISVANNPDNYKNDLTSITIPITDAISDTESLAGGNSTVSSPALSDDGRSFGFDVTDDQLLKLSVKDLNSQMKGLPKDFVKKIKQRRRTLKNRGYAHSCRLKRLEEKSSLQRTKKDLEDDVEMLKQRLQKVSHERDFYKSQFEKMVARQNLLHRK